MAIEKIRPLTWNKNFLFWAFITLLTLWDLSIIYRVVHYVNYAVTLWKLLYLGYSEKKHESHGTINPKQKQKS
jgi:hypothetical protein